MMNIVDEVKKLNVRDYYLVVFVALATILPGYLILFVFTRGLFLSLETFKLLLLATAITLPVYVANLMIFGIFQQKDKSPAFEAAWSAIITTLAMNAAILIAYLQGGTFRRFLEVFGWCEAVAIVLLIVSALRIQPVKPKDPLQGDAQQET